MEVIKINPETDKLRETFLRLLFTGGEGYFCIAYADRARKKFTQEFFSFPDEIPLALELLNRVYQGFNVWFCPHLFTRRERQKQYVSYTPCAWSDLDTCPPEVLIVEPTFLLETSPGRYAGIWMFNEDIDADVAENISHRIAYSHAEDGADRSGWDLTQLLRFPATYNYKYATTPIVKIIDANKNKYILADFAQYDEIKEFDYVDRDIPDISGIDADTLMERERLKMSPTIWRLYQEELPPEESWSEPLWKLMMMLYEVGFNAESVFAVAQAAKCNKYEKRGAPLGQLWKDVVRAEQAHARINADISVRKDHRMAPLVSDEEREQVLSEDSFVERYITWAKSLGDAAPQYHQAGAFTALSALLSGAVQLPTSFGVIKPNLWFMILADTTLTRKSTAMDIVMDLVTEIDDDVIMATDGSIEGMLTSLAQRTSRPSVFLRDEFSGLLEMMTKRDYYAGMPELLTKLYDGKMQKRILRKESIEVRDPCLLVFAGGIKDKITQLLSFEHVSSGFMPRFVFITAESDIARVRPLGPPTEWTDNNRQAILDELGELHAYYAATKELVIKNSDIKFHGIQKVDAQLTPEAWERYNELETLMLDIGVSAERPEIMTPVYDRLSKSILKASVLLAASRKRATPVVVERSDVVRAAAYGENWRSYVNEVMIGVGQTRNEKELDKIYRAIERRPGIKRSQLMQNYHLDARTANAVFETLEQRGQITRQRQGKLETYYPTVVQLQEKA